MLYANDIDGKRISPVKKLKGYCPDCKSEMTPKCGEKMIHHWAHKNILSNCNYKGETEWHRYWKSKFPIENCEIIMQHQGEKRIADVYYNGMIYEFQHSPITSDEIYQRTEFYNNLGLNIIWIFDLTKQFNNQQITIWKNEMTWRHIKDYIFTSDNFYINLVDDRLIEITNFLDEERYTFTDCYGRERIGNRPPKFTIQDVHLVEELDDTGWIFKNNENE